MAQLEAAIELAREAYQAYTVGKGVYDAGRSTGDYLGSKLRDMGKKRKSLTQHVVDAISKKVKTEASGSTTVVVPGVTREAGYYGRFGHELGKMQEFKFFDTNLAFTFDSTGEVPATGQLCLIPQGVTQSQRVGRRCKIHSIQLRLHYSYDAGTTTYPPILYLYLVQDRQTNGAAAAVTDVLTSATMSIAMINMANSARFRIIKRIVIKMTPQAGIFSTPLDSTAFHDYYKKCSIPLDFSSTTGAITELKTNNLFLLAGGNATTDDLVALSGTCRLRFSD